MGHYAIGVPADVVVKNTETMDGLQKRVAFHLVDEDNTPDEHADEFRCGSKFAEIIESAQASGQAIVAKVRRRWEKNGDTNITFYQVEAVQAAS